MYKSLHTAWLAQNIWVARLKRGRSPGGWGKGWRPDDIGPDGVLSDMSICTSQFTHMS